MSMINKQNVFTFLLIAIPCLASIKYCIEEEYWNSGLWFLIALLYFIREVYKHIKYKKGREEKHNERI